MNEQFRGPEQFKPEEQVPINKQEVLDALTSHDEGHEPSLELLRKWIVENQDRIKNNFLDPIEAAFEDFNFQLEKIELYIDAGLWQESLDELEGDRGLIEVAYEANEDEIADKAIALAARVENHLASMESLLPPVITLADMTTEELQEKMDAAIAEEQYELAGQIKAELEHR